MCFAVIGVIASIAGSVIQASAASAQANAQADFQNYQIEVQNRQLQEDKDLAFIEAKNTEIDRREAARRMVANNAAVTAGYTRGGENRSAIALDKYNDDKTRTDVSLIRLNNTYTNARIADQIAVNNVSGMYARWNASVTGAAAWGGAIASGLGSIANYGQSVSRYA